MQEDKGYREMEKNWPIYIGSCYSSPDKFPLEWKLHSSWEDRDFLFATISPTALCPAPK